MDWVTIKVKNELAEHADSLVSILHFPTIEMIAIAAIVAQCRRPVTLSFVWFQESEHQVQGRPWVLKRPSHRFVPMCYVMTLLRSMISCMAFTRLDITAAKDHQSLPTRTSASCEPCLRWAFYRFSFPRIILCSICLGDKPRAVLTMANSELRLYECVQCSLGHCFPECSTSEVRALEVCYQ